MARWLKKLTPEQHAMLPKIRDEWIAHGLSTEPADRPAAEKAIRDLYVACGLEEPRFIVWMSSPWAGVVGAAHLRRLLKDPQRIERLAVTSTTSPSALNRTMGDRHSTSFVGNPFDPIIRQVDNEIAEPLYQMTRTQIETHGEEALFGLNMTFDIQLSPELAGSVSRVLHHHVGTRPIERVTDQVDGQVAAEVFEEMPATSSAQLATTAQVEAQIAGEEANAQVGWDLHHRVDDQVHSQASNTVYRDVKDALPDLGTNIGALAVQVGVQVEDAHEPVDLDVARGLREAVAGQVGLSVRAMVNAQGETMMADPRLVGGQVAVQIGDADGMADLDIMTESTEAIADEVHVDVRMFIDEPRMRLAGTVGRLVDRGVSVQIGAQSFERGPADPVEKIVGTEIHIGVHLMLVEQAEPAQRHLAQGWETEFSSISVNQVQDQVAESVVDHLVERLASRAADTGEMAASFMITDPVSEVRRTVVDAVGDQVGDEVDAQVGDIVRAEVDMFRGQVVVSHDQQIARDQAAEQVQHVLEDLIRRARFAVSSSVEEQVQAQIISQMRPVEELVGSVDRALQRVVEQQAYANPVRSDLRNGMVRAVAAASSRVVASVIREIQGLLGPVQSQIDVEILGLEEDEHAVQPGLHQEWAEGLSRTELSDAFRARWWGSHAGWWCSWLDTYTRLGVKGLPTKAVDAHLRLGRSCGWWFPFRGGVVLTDRPSELHLDGPTNRWGARPLHNETGPALRYRDGYAIHVWHGIRVPAWVIEDPTPERIFAERNAEIRRCAIEVLGWHRLVDDMAIVHECPDPGNAPHTIRLYDMPEGLDVFGDTHTRVVVCTNGSPHRDGSRRDYGLTVPGDFENALEAAAWTYGLTPEKYATLRRRT